MEGVETVTASEAPPEWLSERAAEEWRAVLPLLVAQGLARIDLTLVATYCDLYGQYREASDRVRQEGTTITNRLGNLVPHPCIKMTTSLADSLRKLGSSLGISAGARSRIKVPPKPSSEKDELGAFIKGV
jgi:P27 family predicted phage terminase small subunit